MPINSVPDLPDHLQTAIEPEHATLPPCLCALYTIDRARHAGAPAAEIETRERYARTGSR